ncbi:CPBP family intramembrane glutamic endopeptidase [Streptosporangium sp. NPDC001681]|uniref:CPBP family intramembrane glutamic endopeptidase n=1 Tax=Streptosporangium sp. NPDC001681 TaxID=3154395 RepID=UPI00332D8EB4
MAHNPLSPNVRIQPRVGLGVLGYFLYLAVFYAIFVINGVDYTRVGESEQTLLLWYVLPLTGGAILAIIVVSIYGWWGPAIHERRSLSRWAMTLPIIMMIIAVVNLLFGEFGRVTPLMWVFLIIGSALVGFNEEMINRGQLIVALRSRFGETGVWLLSTAMFAVFHLPNVFLGIGLGGIVQVFFAFGLGSIFYLARRSTGWLISGMVLHGFWDFTVFSTHSSAFPLAGMAAPLLAIVGAITVPIVLAREKRRNATQVVVGNVPATQG